MGTRSALYILVAAFVWCGNVEAAAPQVKTQAPGFYRLMLGSFEITALSDGVFDLDSKAMLTNAPSEVVSSLLTRSFHKVALPTSVNAYLVNTGSRLILIDTGAAKLFGPTLGNLLINLKASGYSPDQIDAILITHLHPDHVGGLMSAGERVFPNATVYASQQEADFWLNDGSHEAVPVIERDFSEQARACTAPYAAAEKLKTFVAPVDLFPGIRAEPTPGHTPGHTLYTIESQAEKLIVWGDLTAVASIQFAQPSVTIAYDSDEHETVAQRRKAYAQAADGQLLVAGAHLPFPGLGHVRREHSGFTWLPVDYNSVR